MDEIIGYQDGIDIFENDVDNPELTREYIQNLEMTLENFVRTLQKAFQNLEYLKGKNIILALGYTGCGKSTMLNSLLFGPESL